MAAVNVTVSFYGQKVTRNTQVAAQEDAWTVSAPNNLSSDMYLVVRPTTDCLYHTTAGQTATDGMLIPGGGFFPVKIGVSTVFYLRPSSTAGTIDSFVATPAMAPLEPYKALAVDSVGALTQGNSQKPTYGLDSLVGAPAAAGYVHFAIESGPTKITRIRRLVISNPGSGTAAALLTFELVRTTAASSGGTLQAPSIYDTAFPDVAFSGVCRKDGATITAGAQLRTFSIFQPATTAGAYAFFVYDFNGQISKALTIPAGSTNGIALRCINGNAGASNFAASFQITEE